MLSIIVPVHNVAEYLPQCLDSLLGDPSTDVEVVAVDDASTDGSAAVLDAYRRSDDRVVVVHLPSNRGLGAARNAGVERASGDFVWFVDSDDWVSAGAVHRVLRRLAQTDPDVLLLGHARVAGTTVTRLANEAHLMDLPPSFCAADAPQVLRLSPSACTKVVRRQLLHELDLRFPEGAYEDVAVSLPLLCAAGRISALADVCLYYRMRHGSIVHTSGPHHLDLVRQYGLVLQRLSGIVVTDAVQSAVYETMVRQLFEVLRSTSMTPREREMLLAEGSALLRRSRPRRHRATSALAALRDRALRLGWLAVIDRLVGVHRSVVDVGGVARRGTRTLERLWQSLRRERVRAIVNRAASRLYYRWQCSRPIDPDLVVYSEYWGQQAGVCNPAAIHAKVVELVPRLRAAWIVDSVSVAVPAGAEAIVVGTRPYYRSLARARYVVANSNLGDEFVKRAGMTFIQTQHGTPLKSMGIDVPGQTSEAASRMLRRSTAWDVCLSSNPHSSSVWKRAFPVEFELLESGYPRNDVLARASTVEVQRARSALGLAADVTAILYAPTFRDGAPEHRTSVDPAGLARALGPGHVLMVRAHYSHGSGAFPLEGPDNVIDASSPPISQLYLAADVLITDYSSAMFDFAVLDRPIVVFAPDQERYSEIRGTYFDIEAGAPGFFAPDFDSLVHAFASGEIDGSEARRRRTAFRSMFCPWDDGRAAERVVRTVISVDR